MKILHITPFYRPATEWGGPVRSVAALARGQRELGHDVTVVTTNTRGAPGLPALPAGVRELDGETVVYHPVNRLRRFAFSAGIGPDVRRRAAEADIAHVHGLWTWPTAAGSRACRSRGLPYVLSPRGMLLEWALTQKSLKKKLYRALVQDRAVLGAALLHCTSQRELQELPERYRSRPAAVVPNPIDMDDLLELPAGPFRDRPFRLLMAGRIHPVKGFDRLLPALAQVRKGGLDFRLTVAGGDEGGYLARVEAMASRYGVRDLIDFAGRLERGELVNAYREAAALVMPSYQENFGMSAAEAMAAGRPVIVSEGVNIAPQVGDAGAGMVVSADPDSIAGGIAALAADPEMCRRMAGNGRAYAMERFSPAGVATAMLQAYRGVLDREAS